MKNRSVYGIDHIGFRDESDRREKRDNAGEQGGRGGFKKQLGCSPNVCYVLLALDCIYSSREERESLAIVH